ncbi:FkbM family methyltransferase [Candidatus Pelagibacter sp.]|nr:FkbM family methyltransferase [Candidatus Pelagibacter sp.]
MTFNYLIFLISRFFYILLPLGKTRIFNILIRLSIKKWKYSYYNVKIINQNFKDITYRLCLGGGYGDFYSLYLKGISKKFIFLDFGSNLGIYSLIANKNSNCNFILAFDPLLDIKKKIIKNFKLNRVKGIFYNVGIFDKNIKKKLYISENHSGASSIIKPKNIYNHIDVVLKNYLFLKKITSKYKNNIYFIKIDVEGAEHTIINELEKSNILKNTQSIFIEIRSPNLSFKKRNIKAQLNKNNFFLKKFIEPHDYLFEKL